MTPFSTLITPAELEPHLNNPQWVIVDCRFNLAQTNAGRHAYQQGHIPGAIYAHLDEDLSGPIIAGQTSRHPLPAIKTFSQTASQWGIGEGVQVVAYDDRSGAIAARLWWMLHWLGHNNTAVLNGGWSRWLAEDKPISNASETPTPRQFTPQIRPERLATASEVLTRTASETPALFDSRAPERYRGEYEPIDSVAGHIPGAINAPFAQNLTDDGQFLPPPALKTRFENLLGQVDPSEAVFYCGSGVTAAHNLLALAHSGLGHARLYAGSWSEWITNPERPIAKADAT